jgi:hypothetical protein
MNDCNLNALLDDDRSRYLDTVDWLHALDEEAFQRHVGDDARARADEMVSRALRHPKLRHRWTLALKALRKHVEQQVKVTGPSDRGDYAAWREKVAWFKTHLEARALEAKSLTLSASQPKDPEKIRAGQLKKGGVGQVAVDRLVEAHKAEFTRYLVEEYAREGLELPDGLYRATRQILADQEAGDG